MCLVIPQKGFLPRKESGNNNFFFPHAESGSEPSGHKSHSSGDGVYSCTKLSLYYCLQLKGERTLRHMSLCFKCHDELKSYCFLHICV